MARVAGRLCFSHWDQHPGSVAQRELGCLGRWTPQRGTPLDRPAVGIVPVAAHGRGGGGRSGREDPHSARRDVSPASAASGLAVLTQESTLASDNI